jgi:hypothetical protein
MTAKERLRIYRITHEVVPREIEERKKALRAESDRLAEALRKTVKNSNHTLKTVAQQTGFSWSKVNNILHGNVWFIDPDDAERILETID